MPRLLELREQRSGGIGRRLEMQQVLTTVTGKVVSTHVATLRHYVEGER
jgi:hypothetical protein